VNRATRLPNRPWVRCARCLVLAVGLGAALGAAQGPAPGAGGGIATFPPLPQGQMSIIVNDSQGRFVGRILPQNRYWVTLDRIPAFLQQALLAVEDARFYEHGGIDLRGIARAFLKDVTKGRMAEGGSTITQQLVKNQLQDSAPTLDRKLREARMAMDYEKKYTKQQILEMYFNDIYFGNGANGIAQAARLYFDKTPDQLTPGECLLLAGVPKNPGRYNPFGTPADVGGRRDVVLKRMVELNLITPAQRQEFWANPARVQARSQAPQYLAAIRAQLTDRFGAEAVEQGGLDVTAAMDLNLQQQAEQALRTGVQRLAPGLQGALVCMDPATGDVLAAVGDAAGNASSLNRAFSSQRQPGSAIKPLIYAAALEQGVTAASIWNDTPVAYDRGNGATWKPRNFEGETFGDLTLRQALAVSNNVVTVKLLDQIGVPRLVAFAGSLGLSLKPESGLSLALGTDDVTLANLVQAYTPFAAGGMKAEARTVLRIYDRRKQTWQDNPPALTPVLSPAAAFVLTGMLHDVMVYGTAKSLKAFSQAHVCAGKTGTTEEAKDAWFVGYTPQLLTGVWVGYDQPRGGGPGFTGGAIAAPIWQRFMARAVTTRPEADFPRPADVVTVSVDPATGQFAPPNTANAYLENFIAGTEPKDPNAVPPAAPEPVPASGDTAAPAVPAAQAAQAAPAAQTSPAAPAAQAGPAAPPASAP